MFIDFMIKFLTGGLIKFYVFFQLEQEIVTLKRNLKQAQTTVDRTHAHMELQKSRTRQLISAWKQRLEDGEEQLQRHRGYLDNQMKAIATELFRFEGKIPDG